MSVTTIEAKGIVFTRQGEVAFEFENRFYLISKCDQPEPGGQS